jgi:hypothetical protein
VHVAAVFAKLHATPHPPQFAVESSDASHPFAGLPSQSPNPGAQRSPHVPAAQNAVEFGPAGQAASHAPQAFGSFCVLRHEPEQSVSPAPHDTSQVPIEQTSPAAHA